MTRDEIKRVLNEAAERYGFITEETRWTTLLSIRERDTHYLNFTVLEHLRSGGLDTERRTATLTVSVRASIAQMGGNPTADELLTASDTIRRGAEMVKELEAMDLSFVESW